MLGRLYGDQDCSAARALEVVGERWSLLILRDAMFGGLTRFSQFQASLGIATNVLAKRLEGFVEDGLMERCQEGPPGEQREYILTRKGMEIKPVIVALTAWGDKWVRPGPIVFHDTNGASVEIALRAVEGGAEVDLENVVATLRRKRRKRRNQT